MKKIDLEAILKKLKAKTKLRKKKCYNPSKLDDWRYELIELRQKGATYSELREFMKNNRKPVVISTISRWFKKNG